MPKGRSTTNQEKRQASKRLAREKKAERANNVLTRNTSVAERARRRGESTAQASRPNPLMEAVRKMRGNA